MSDNSDLPPVHFHFLAGIGNICLQWALLEQNLLGIIAAAEHIPMERTYTRYGSTDMMPRIRLAIRLTEEAHWPIGLRNRLKDIRKALQKERGRGLAEYRNLYVHGAHKSHFPNGDVELIMVRWPSGDRTQIVNATDAAQLGLRLGELAQEAHSIYCDYGTWKFDTKLGEQGRKNVAQAKAHSRLVRAQQIKRGIKLLLANLKPWR